MDDERIYAVVVAMSQGPLSRDPERGYYCIHCQQTWKYDEDDGPGHIAHTPKCPVTLAREVMTERMKNREFSDREE